jgi:hypothetical protein
MKSPIDAYSLLDEALRSCLPRFAAKDLRLALNLHARQRLIHSDPTCIHHILSTLLDTAVQHSPAGATIIISSANTPEGELEIEIADTGTALLRLPVGPPASPLHRPPTMKPPAPSENRPAGRAIPRSANRFRK